MPKSEAINTTADCPRFDATKNGQIRHASDAPRPIAHGMRQFTSDEALQLILNASITTPPTRKRQKKADSRVAELERKIDALTATLHAQKGGPEPPRPYPNVPQYEGGPATYVPAEGSYRAGSITHEWTNAPPAPDRYPDIPPGYSPAQNMQRGPESKRRKLGDGSSQAAVQTIPEDMDAVHRDLIEHIDMKRTGRKGVHTDHSNINTLIDSLMTPETAERIFRRYVNEICPHFPAVPLPPGTTARELREKKPLLFLSILAGSSHGAAEQLVSQDVQRDLTKMLKDQFADIIWRNGEKSLEVVQALQVGVLWYRPPLHYEQHNFYMMVNCAAVMALDLGLGRRNAPTVMKLAVGPFKRCHPNTSSVESRRTFLVCYYLCMSITMVLRRPILLRWTKYMEESVKILETSPEALPSDKILCQHVKMAHIGENISVQFCMDDPSVEVAISEPKVIYALKLFENELQQLRDENAALFKEVDRKSGRVCRLILMLTWHSCSTACRARHESLHARDCTAPQSESCRLSSALHSRTSGTYRQERGRGACAHWRTRRMPYSYARYPGHDTQRAT